MFKEKLYLAGALRDGSISTQYQIKVKQKSKEWLVKVIIPFFNKVFGTILTEKAIYKQEDENLRYYLLFKNKTVWHKLRDEFEISFNQKSWETPSFVKKAPKNIISHYIRGFYDAEGGVPGRIAVGSKIYLSFTQRNKKALEFLREKLLLFGIKPGIIYMSDKKSKSFRFFITERRSILNYIGKIETLHPYKKDQFNKIKKFLLKVR